MNRYVIRIVATLLTLMVTVAALGASLDELRAQGTVGEAFDGFARARVSDPTDEVKQLIQSVNAKRREIYSARAAEEGVPEDQVGRVYAKEIYAKAADGTWFLSESGEWRQKQS